MGQPAAPAHLGDRLLEALLRDPGGVGVAQRDDAPGTLLRAGAGELAAGEDVETGQQHQGQARVAAPLGPQVGQRGRDQGERPDEVGALRGHQGADGAAEGVAEQVHRPGAALLDAAHDRPGVGAQPVALGRRRGRAVAEPGQVHRLAVEAVGEQRDQVGPVGRRAAQPVHHERRLVPADRSGADEDGAPLLARPRRHVAPAGRAAGRETGRRCGSRSGALLGLVRVRRPVVAATGRAARSSRCPTGRSRSSRTKHVGPCPSAVSVLPSTSSPDSSGSPSTRVPRGVPARTARSQSPGGGPTSAAARAPPGRRPAPAPTGMPVRSGSTVQADTHHRAGAGADDERRPRRAGRRTRCPTPVVCSASSNRAGDPPGSTRTQAPGQRAPAPRPGRSRASGTPRTSAAPTAP